MKKVIYAAIALLSLLSCTKEISYNGNYDGEKLVVYACANPGTLFSASCYKSLFILTPQIDYSDLGLSGVDVKILVNGTDSYDFTEVKEERSVRYYSEYIPKEGDHITLTASHPDLPSVKAETVVPQAPRASISNVSWRSVDESYYRELQFNLTIDDPSEVKNFYRVNFCSYEEWGEEWRYLLSNDVMFYDTSIGGIVDSVEDTENIVPDFFDDGGFDGKKRRISMFVRVFTAYDEFGNFVYDDDLSKYKITVDNVTESMYLYQRSRDAASGGGGLDGLFGEQARIYSNVEGGLGCVCALSSVELHPMLSQE